MKLRTKAAAVAVTAVAVIGGGTAYAVTASTNAQQVISPDVYACVNQAGGVDYLEFRLPIPHPCWYPTEQLWRWSVNPTPAPTVTATVG